MIIEDFITTNQSSKQFEIKYKNTFLIKMQIN